MPEQNLTEFTIIKALFKCEQQNQMHKIHITNQDSTFITFLRLLHKENILQEVNNLRVKQSPYRHISGNRYKKGEVQFFPFEGEYAVEFKGQKLVIEIQRGTHVLTDYERQVDYLKNIAISAPTLEKAKGFVEYIFSKMEDQQTEEKITIYENQDGYWNVTKQKKPRKLQSVIFKEQFTKAVVNDITEFIDSEDWYAEMGIPYKRSYLFYGPPGTGKSSFAQAIAGQIKFSICFVNCSDNINDFQFNSLLNQAPEKSIILIEDVDSIFSQRKNAQKNNSLTFSGFLNAIDGVRSQEGRIIIMTTNYKERLDPALLRPGRVDEMYEIRYSSRFQIQKLCFRFFKDEELAKKFAEQLPQNKFSMSMIQGFLLRYRKSPKEILDHVKDLLESDENIKIEQFLTEINCQEIINQFKIQECYNLSHARSLPKDTLEKMITALNPLLKGRFLETIRSDRKTYIKSPEELIKFVEENYKDEMTERQLKKFIGSKPIPTTFYQIRDKAKELEKPQK